MYSFYEPFYRDLIHWLSERFPPPQYSGHRREFMRQSYLNTAVENLIELLMGFPDVNPAELIDMRWWEVCYLMERPSGISTAAKTVLRAEAKVLEEAEHFMDAHRFDYGVIL